MVTRSHYYCCRASGINGWALIPQQTLKESHDVAAAMLGILGTLYAIVLGLIVVESITRHTTAESQESQEASALITISHLARGTAPQYREKLLDAELAYCTNVLDREWPLLGQRKAPDPETIRSFAKLSGIVVRFEPKTAGDQNLHAAMINSVIQLGDARRYRLISSKQDLPLLLWTTLIVGGVCTIAFTYFFSAQNIKVQIVMTILITLVFSMNTLLVFFYSQPYRGDLRVEPATFKRTLKMFKHRQEQTNDGDDPNYDGEEAGSK